MPLKTFLSNKINSQKYRLNGLIPSGRLPNKRQLCQTFRDHVLYQAGQLPPKVDLRSDMTPVEDQSQIGSCAANCLAGAYEYLSKKANGRNTDVSRLFIYYNARAKDQKTQNVVDSGCTMTSAIEALEEMGTCLESIWPYDISRVNSRPNEQSYQEAKRHKITEALQVDINLHEMKSCLAQGFPFAFGLKLYSSFDQAKTTGVVPMPAAGDNGRQSHGSHALLAVGYSDHSKAFIVRNSWGEHWGENGYCYIPYDYVTNPNLSFDVWAIRKISTDSFSRDHWDVNDAINYTRKNKQFQFNNHLDVDSSSTIEYLEDDNEENNYNPWNQYQGYGGAFNRHQKKNERHRNIFERHPSQENFFYNQFREENNFFGGFPDMDPFVNNLPINQFAPPFSPPPPPFFPQQPYGLSYGYSNDFFNPFF